MVRVRIREKPSQQIAARNYSFTVVFESGGSGARSLAMAVEKAAVTNLRPRDIRSQCRCFPA